MKKLNTKDNLSRPPFIGKLEAVKRLQEQADAIVFDWVKLLVEVADDEEFRDRLRGQSKTGAVDDSIVYRELDKYTLARTGFEFERLAAFYRRWPERQTWAENGLPALDDMLAAEAAKKADKEVKLHRRAVKLADFEEVQRECQKLAADVKKEQAATAAAEAANRTLGDNCQQMRAIIKSQKERIDELEDEVKRLRDILLKPLPLVA